MTLVFAGEAFNQIILVLKDALTKSCSDAGIKRTTGTTAPHVDVRNFVHKQNTRSLRATRALITTPARENRACRDPGRKRALLTPFGMTLVARETSSRAALAARDLAFNWQDSQASCEVAAFLGTSLQPDPVFRLQVVFAGERSVRELLCSQIQLQNRSGTPTRVIVFRSPLTSRSTQYL